MKGIADQIFRKYGAASVIGAAVFGLLVWLLAHFTAAPGHRVVILWGLVEYTKKGITQESSEPGTSLDLTDEASRSERNFQELSLEDFEKHDTILRNYNRSDFHIEEQNVILDLTHRQKVDPKYKYKFRISPAIWKQRLTIVRTKETAKYYVKEFFTSGLTPDAVCTSPHNFTFHSDTTYEAPQGRDNLRRFFLLMDVRHETVNMPFDLELQLIFWNSFQGETQSYAEIAIRNPTDRVYFKLIWPPNKYAKGDAFEFFRYLEDSLPEIYRLSNENKAINEDNLVWLIPKPLYDYRYKVRWSW
jgi:hypothetical protein